MAIDRQSTVAVLERMIRLQGDLDEIKPSESVSFSLQELTDLKQLVGLEIGRCRKALIGRQKVQP